MRIAIIGAGAAGCFAAVNLRRMLPHAPITIYESGRRPLAKVAVSGGGRCNLTNSFGNVRSLSATYPRGERLMKRLLREFGHTDACGWFEREGVRLTTQDDGCVFPRSQDAMEIVNTLTRLLRDGDIAVRTAHRVSLIEPVRQDTEHGNGGGGYRIRFADGELPEARAGVVLVTTGGFQKRGSTEMLRALDVDIVEPVPSLFSICLPGDGITSLTGTVTEHAEVGIAGTRLRAEGPLLITHWGMSGPAILKLSSYAARMLHDNGYRAALTVNWLGGAGEAETAGMLAGIASANPQKMVATVCPPGLNARLWAFLLSRCGVDGSLRWSETGRKGINRMVNVLTNSMFQADGRCRFKEEFVTCGGVSLGSINPGTLECRAHKGLFFAGEVLDVDAVTGGFNLQAAWTMGHTAAKSIASSIKSDDYDK